MEITEVRIKLMDANGDKLRAFCSITIDNDFVIRDLKVIEGLKEDDQIIIGTVLPQAEVSPASSSSSSNPFSGGGSRRRF